ncbi:MAG TPA: mechanosensitive ion channel domain-containing protein [Burkholderiales bacterium]|nr:mechanosensitive ion channel domain-containing protein [Burkholderiales bacterium]
MKNQSEVGRLLADLLDDLQRGAILWQIVIIALALLIAWQVARHLRRRLAAATVAADPERTMKISVGGMNRELFPVTALVLLLIGRWALENYQPIHLLNIAVPLVLAMVIIRGGVYLLRHTFAPGGRLRSWEVATSWLVWSGVALHIVGLLPAIGRFLEDTAFRIGQQRLSLAMVLTAFLTVVLTVLAALWIGRMLEGRIMALQHVEINLRFAFTKILRTILVVVAVLIALPIVGIDITVLSVFGGALGVGIGFGLQKVASNYISGFTILLDRTVSPGDLVTVDHFYGEVTKLTSRCIIVRGPDGTEAIVPNETLITSTVINHSYSNRRVLMRIPVQISYSSNLESALKLMLEAAYSHSRVLKDPAPTALLTAFGDNGINLELLAWIEDPERGKLNLNSDLNLALYKSFAANGIEIPFPQRDIRIVGGLNSGDMAPK